jgi:hypothetical protein
LLGVPGYFVATPVPQALIHGLASDYFSFVSSREDKKKI